MKKWLLSSCVALCAAILSADTFVWTGAEDAYWTNAANWKVEGGADPATRCPGSVIMADKDAQWAAFLDEDDTVVFDETGVKPANHIDLDGHLAVKTSIFRGDMATAYVFGCASYPNQTRPDWYDYGHFSIKSGGSMTFESTLTQAPVFKSGVTPGQGDAGTTTFINNSAVTFSLGTLFGMIAHRETASNYWPVHVFQGSGAFSLPKYIANGSTFVGLTFQHDGLTTITGTIGGITPLRFEPTSSGAVRQVEIVSGVDLKLDGHDWTDFIVTDNAHVFGEGTLVMQGRNGFVSPRITISEGKTLDLACKQLTVSGNDGKDWWLDTRAAGTLLFSSPLAAAFLGTYSPYTPATSGNVQMRGGSGTIASYAVGAPGGTPFATSSRIYVGSGCTFAYVGEGEGEGRTFALTNFASKAGNASAKLAQRGTGDWTVAGVADLSWAGKTNTLTLENDTEYAATIAAPLVQGNGTLSVVKTGSGTWTLAGANAYSGTTTLQGGTLAFTASSQIGPIAVGGDVTIVIPDGATVQASSLSRTAGTLDIKTAGTGKLKLASSTFGLGEAWLTVNGKPAQVQIDGTVSAADHTWTSTLNIPAYGGIIPNDATAGDVVGITTDGTGDDPITLAGATGAAVAGIIQKTAADATIVLTNNQTLTAALLAVEPTAGSLTVTTNAAGCGAFAMPGNKLSFDVGNATSTLSVEVPFDLAGKTLVKAGPGAAEVPATSVFAAAHATVDGGSLAYLGADAARVTTAKPEDAEMAAYDVANTAEKMTLAVTGDGLVVSGTNTVAHPLGLSVPGGAAMRITGNGTALKASGITIGSSAGAGSLTVDDGAEVVFDVNGIKIGGDLTVSNATVKLVTPGTTTIDANAMQVGWKSVNTHLPGRLIVEKDAVITNRVIVGYRALGALIVNGGTICIPYSLGSRNNYIGYQIYSEPYDGYVRVNGGSFGYVNYTTSYYGNMDIAGGDFGPGASFVFADAADGVFHLRMTGGQMPGTGNVAPCGGVGDSVFTIEGTAEWLNYGYRTMANRPEAGHKAIVNLNGGIWDARNIARYTDSKTGKSAQGKIYANLNGGTWIPGFGGEDVIPGCDRATVYENGITFRMERRNKDAPFYVSALRAPTGKGVTGVVGFVPLTDRVTPPCVIVEGDGDGASAAPEFDEKTGTLTGIAVTSHGWDYTWAKVHLVTHNGATVTNATYDCTLAANRAGGLTLESTNSNWEFKLTGSNEVSGVTVKNGILLAGVAGSVPTAADVVLTGGRLDMGTNDLVFASLSGTGGTLMGVTNAVGKMAVTTANPGTGLSGVAFKNSENKTVALNQTCNGAWNLDAADVAAGKTVSVMGELIFGANATLTVTGDLTKLDETKKYTIFEATAGSFTGVPTLTSPTDWKLKAVGSTLRLYKPKGMLLIVR